VKFDEYLNFVLRIVLIFGLAFELPVFLVALNLGGILRGKSILKVWRLAVFGIVLFAGIFVPTGDPITMMVLAIPMILFYFGAGFFGVFNDRKRDKKALLAESVD
jgi:sec-independent protein translocase protein TatC